MTHAPQDPARIAIYTRISKDDRDLDPGVGVRDQARQCRELVAKRFPAAQITGPGCQCDVCEAIGVPGDVYCDNDISASGKKRRPHYERLLADILARQIDAVVAVHSDRLHRNMTELEPYVKACKDIPSYFVKAADLDLSNASGRMVARMLGAAAAAELERTQERIASAKLRNRLAGERSGSNAPFGYEHDHRDERGRQTADSRGLRIIPAEAEAIRLAYRDVLSGVSLYEIARRLNEAGLRTHRRARGRASMGDGTWKQVTVRHMLLRAANAALIEHPASPPGRGEIIGHAKWEPIVSEDTYYAARALLTDAKRNLSPGMRPAHLLTGVLICGVCGGTRFAARPMGGVRTYCCNERGVSGSRKVTAHLARKADPLDELAEKAILLRLAKPDILRVLNAAPEVDIQSLLADRNGLRARLDEAGALFARQVIDAQTLAVTSRDLLPRIDAAEKAIADAVAAQPADAGVLGRFVADPAGAWAAASLDEKRAVARIVIRIRLLPVGIGGGVFRKGIRRGQRPPIDPDTVLIEYQV
jgi:DNA invertase Pin-like site-specific DNA recombinase